MLTITLGVAVFVFVIVTLVIFLMIAKSKLVASGDVTITVNDDPDKAIVFFQQVRTLAKGGAADSLGLAAASFGWEAKVQLQRKHYPQAVRLYLNQLATGDATAAASLMAPAALALW